MSGAYSRNRGARAERELCALLREYLGVEATRQYKQYAQAQHGDIEELIGPYLIECKNQARITLGPWWEQARAAAQARKAVPCVAYRLPNRGLYDRWRFVVPLNEAWSAGQDWKDSFRYTADVGLEGFALLVREFLSQGVKSDGRS
ncbi:TPA: hypothetical protein QEK98_002976 [Stenotrophomonas maltophilia]|nr:hypothetical protein [Stenotrophomonas maltophilia]